MRFLADISLRDVKTDIGGWTTRAVTHIGLDTERNREKAEELIGFLTNYASDSDTPTAVGTIDEDFLAGLRLGILLGPLSLPIAPILIFRDFYSLNYYIAQASGSIEQAVEATQLHLSKDDRKKLVEWIRSIPGARNKAVALFFKWSYQE
jgi:hypothetical protein